MVMHARKPQRIGDGYHFEKHQAHPYQNSKYSSSKSSYDKDRMRERDSPNGNSYRSDSPECDSPRDRDRLYHTKTSSYISKSRDRDYKSRDRYSDCVRSPKDKRSRIDSDHRTNHDRNSSEKMLLNSVKNSQNSSRETSQRKVSSSCQDKRDDRERVTRVGDWSEHVSSSGKKYYYNCKTEVSQWEKPREWVDRSHRHTSSSSSYLHHSSSSHPNSRTGGSNVVEKHSNSRGGSGGVSNSGGSSKPLGQQVSSQSQAQPILPPQSVQSGQLPPQASQQGMVPPPQGMVPPPQNMVPPPQGIMTPQGVHPPQGVLPPPQGMIPSQGVSMSQNQSVGRGSIQPVPAPTGVPPPSGYWSTPHLIDTPAADPRKQDSQSNNNSGMVDGVATDMEICSGDSTPTSETSYSIGAVAGGIGPAMLCEGGANTPGPPTRVSPTTDQHRPDDHSPPTPIHENQDCKVGGSLLAGSSLAALRPQGPNLTPSLANHYRDDLVNHVRGWPADLIEKQAQKSGEEAYQLGTMCARVSAELKCPRSIVRQTEIQATRQEQRVLFLRQQIKTLEELKSQNSFMADET